MFQAVNPAISIRRVSGELSISQSSVVWLFHDIWNIVPYVFKTLKNFWLIQLLTVY